MEGCKKAVFFHLIYPGTKVPGTYFSPRINKHLLTVLYNDLNISIITEMYWEDAQIYSQKIWA